MVKFKLKNTSDLLNFSLDKEYVLSTVFVEDSDKEFRYLKLTDDKKKERVFFPKEFYKNFQLVK